MSFLTVKNPTQLDLPPGFTLVPLRESGDAFAHACRIAPEAGAATLVWVRRFDVAEFAVILEPETPLPEARKAFFVCMNAVADAISVHCPPEKQLQFRWPDTFAYDGGLVGGARLGIPKKMAEDAVPDWLVFGAMVRTAFPDSIEPGMAPTAVALEEEGFDAVSAGVLVESFARHLLHGVDIFLNRGFGPAAKDFAARVTKDRAADRVTIADNGDCVITSVTSTKPRVLPFATALKTPTWLDVKTGMPKL